MENKLNILLISSESLSRRSSRLALDQYKALKAYGHNVNVLTKYDDSNNPDIIAVCGQGDAKKPILSRIRRKLTKLFRPEIKQNTYFFFYKDELHPPVPVNKVLSKITKQYDLVLVSFWQNLLSAKTVFKISEKTKCPILLYSVDMSPMTGGCHYFWNCRRFQTGCGCCPAIQSDSPNDFTHFNLEYRRKKFAQMQCAFLGNSYINSFAEKSLALQGVMIEKGPIIVNEQEFAPHDKVEMRKILNIEETKKFVIFAGAETLEDSRKGMNLLIDSVNRFYDSLHESERTEVVLLFAGRVTSNLLDNIHMEARSLGYIDFEKLPYAYAAADLFLCPSVLDAGPMMVNQSLSCGTPVVAFEMGTALDVIKGQNTGYCARLGDVEDFAKGIEQIYKLSDEQHIEISKNCREMALQTSSYDNFCQNTMRVYNKLKV